MKRKITLFISSVLMAALLSGCVWYGGHSVPFHGHGFQHHRFKHFDHHDFRWDRHRHWR